MLSRKFAIRTISKALLILSSPIGRNIRFKVVSGALASGGRSPWGRVFIVRVSGTRREGPTGVNFDCGPVQKEAAIYAVCYAREGGDLCWSGIISSVRGRSGLQPPLCRINQPTNQPPLSSLVPRHSPMFATLFKARTRPFNVPKSRIFTIIIYDRGKGRMRGTWTVDRERGWKTHRSREHQRTNEILDRPPASDGRNVATLVKPSRKHTRGLRWSRFSFVLFRLFSLAVSSQHSGFYDVCKNVGIDGSACICRKVIENIHRPKDWNSTREW